MAVSHLKLSETMVRGTSNQGKGVRVKQARVTSLRHFLVSDVIIFLQYHIEKCFNYHFKVSSICDEYIHKILEWWDVSINTK